MGEVCTLCMTVSDPLYEVEFHIDGATFLGDRLKRMWCKGCVEEVKLGKVCVSVSMGVDTAEKFGQIEVYGFRIPLEEDK